MTARQRRSFDDAFAGVFGERPDRLYGQFTAELTASAMAIRESRQPHEGALFQETPRASGEPAVSPDGAQIAVVIRAKDKPEELVIWSTSEPTEEEKKQAERIERMLARDPEDVAPVRTKPLPRKEVHALTMPDGGDIDTPRWTRDGKAIVFAHRLPDAAGVLHFDLYRWDFKNVRRITHLADVRDADPLDERTAVAVRSRFGASQLVTVDLASGKVTPRGKASIDHVFTSPRVSADGKRVAHVAHHGGRWTLYVDDTPIALPGDPASPAWLSNDELVVTVFSGGFAELHRVTPDGTATQITRSAGGAFDPAPASDGRIFFTSLNPDGYVLRELDPSMSSPAERGTWVGDADLIPAIPPLPRTPPTFTAEELDEPRPYGLGKQEFSWLASQNFAPDYRATELGVRLGDVVGRLDTLLLASYGDTEGVALASAWRGWPVEMHAHAFRTEDQSNVELRGLWSRRFPRSRLTLEGGALTDDLAFASAAFNTRQTVGALRFEEGARVDLDDQHHRIVLAGAVRTGSLRIAAREQRDRGATVALGGIASSILPRSAYALRILDPALPVAILGGDEYDGWRIESTLPGLPFTAFYQRHEIGARKLALAGAEIALHSDPFPILKFPGLDLTLGAARILDEPLRGETKWWLAARWRP